MPTVAAYAAGSPSAPLGPHRIERRAAGAHDVALDVQYCGVCHSDLHTARGEWRGTTFPCVPGHEIVGRVTAVGQAVTRFGPGDMVAVGCLVDSCRQCGNCREGLEQYCTGGATWTYNSADRHLGGVTYGGYSAAIVVDEHFVLRLPDSLDPAAAAPLLCAGVTTYSPLTHWRTGPTSRVGVVGLGGLGHMAVKLADAMGAHVTVFTTSPDKAKDALRLGADDTVLSSDASGMKAKANTLDLIINTVSVPHSLDPYLATLRRDGTLVLVGVPPEPHPSPDVSRLIGGRRGVAGSLIGGVAETQEMLDFCATHGLTADVERIAVQGINEAWDRMVAGKVKYRFVIDMSTLNG